MDEIATRARRAGLDGVELFGDVDSDPDQSLRTLDAKGLKVFSVTPDDADISHLDPGIRNAGLSYYDRLMDWAAALGNPTISCHGQVGRIAPVGTQSEEDELLVSSTATICANAQKRGLEVVFEILNRYETHQVNTVSAGLVLLDAVGASNLKLLPDAYHMNIEEADPAGALIQCGSEIGLYHAADSNRCGVGEGHTDFAAQIRALDHVAYAGPIILECNAVGPNPFSPEKTDPFQEVVEIQLERSVTQLRKLCQKSPV